MLVAPRSVELTRGLVVGLSRLDWDQAAAVLADLTERGRDVLRQGSVTDAEITFETSADMRYVGQGFEVTVPLSAAAIATRDPTVLQRAFDAQYRERFARSLAGMQVELVSWRVRSIAPAPVTEVRFAGNTLRQEPLIEHWPAYFVEAGRFVDTPVYARAALRPDTRIEGPALIEEAESTAVIGPSAHLRVDAFGNLTMHLKAVPG